MGKSKHTRSAQQIDTKYADFEGKTQKLGKINDSDFSGISTSRFLQDPSLSDSAALTTVRNPCNGAVGGAVVAGNGVTASADAHAMPSDFFRRLVATLAVSPSPVISAAETAIMDGCVPAIDGSGCAGDSVEDTESSTAEKSIDYPDSSAARVSEDGNYDDDGTESTVARADVKVADLRQEDFDAVNDLEAVASVSHDDVHTATESEDDEEDRTVVAAGDATVHANRNEGKIEINSGQPSASPMVQRVTIDTCKDATFEERLAEFLRAGHRAKSVTINGIVIDISAMDSKYLARLVEENPPRWLDAKIADNGEKLATLDHSGNLAGLPEGKCAEKSGNKAQKSWAGIVKTNRHPDEDVHDLELDKRELDAENTLDMEEDDCTEESIEKLSLVGLFSSKFPGRNAVHRMVNSWPRKCNYHYHNSGWIIFSFCSEDDALEVLHRGPYRPFGMPLTLKRMPRFFNFNIEDHSIVPIWIQLPNLPLRFWSKKGLSKICSQVGRPLHTDKMTAAIKAPSFARCLVDVDVSKPLRTSLYLRPPNGRKFNQPILYEHIPRYCLGCKRLGHLVGDCKGIDHVVTSVYVPKKQVFKPANNVVKENNIKGKESANVAKNTNGAAEVSAMPKAVESRAAGAHLGAAGQHAGAAGPVSGAAVAQAVPVSGAAMAQAVPVPSAAVAQAVAAKKPGADVHSGAAQQGKLDDEWMVARGNSKKGNKFETPEKDLVKKPIISPGTYDVLSDKENNNGKKKNKNKSRKKKKKKKNHG